MEHTLNQRKTNYAAIDGWHGEYGHFNVLVRDHDDICTAFGKHDRVMTTLPQYDDEFGCVVLYCRVDLKWGLGEPTAEQILQVARKHDGTKGKWVLATREPWDNGTSIGYHFVRAQ